MIDIKVYKNGYEIIGHADEKICHQVSLWHWIGSNLILGLDNKAKEYTSHRDNPTNPKKGYTWVIFSDQGDNLAWIIEDLIVSAEKWAKEYWGDNVSIERLDRLMMQE